MLLIFIFIKENFKCKFYQKCLNTSKPDRDLCCSESVVNGTNEKFQECRCKRNLRSWWLYILTSLKLEI